MSKHFFLFCCCLLAAGSAIAQGRVAKQSFVYAVKDGMSLQLDMYDGKSPEIKGKRPVMIYVHGGGFAMGSSKNALQIQYAKHFTSQGFVAVLINYRLGLKGSAQPPQDSIMRAVAMAVEDLMDATAFIITKSAEWNIDTGKIIISGGSAGAITCLTAAYEISSGGKAASRLPTGFNYAGVISHAGNVIVHQDTLLWKKAPCPILLMHGSADQLVSFTSLKIQGNLYAGSKYLHDQFTALHVPHWLYEEVGADHIVALKPLQYNFAETDAFIEKFVLQKTTAIVHTKWADKKPDSMQDMMKVVPLYINGWDKTDDEVQQKQ